MVAMAGFLAVRGRTSDSACKSFWPNKLPVSTNVVSRAGLCRSKLSIAVSSVLTRMHASGLAAASHRWPKGWSISPNRDMLHRHRLVNCWRRWAARSRAAGAGACQTRVLWARGTVLTLKRMQVVGAAPVGARVRAGLWCPAAGLGMPHPKSFSGLKYLHGSCMIWTPRMASWEMGNWAGDPFCATPAQLRV